jgi:uncharacterized glyoxalase superfamily protein PhnB
VKKSPMMLIDCEQLGAERRIELLVPDVDEAWSFYRDIMGAEEVFRIALGAGGVSEIGLTIGRAAFVIASDRNRETGGSRPTLALLAEDFGVAFAAVVLYVRDPGAVVRRALSAGSQRQSTAGSGTPCYGDHPVDVIVDPFGHSWAFAMSAEAHSR